MRTYLDIALAAYYEGISSRDTFDERMAVVVEKVREAVLLRECASEAAILQAAAILYVGQISNNAFYRGNVSMPLACNEAEELAAIITRERKVTAS